MTLLERELERLIEEPTPTPHFHSTPANLFIYDLGRHPAAPSRGAGVYRGHRLKFHRGCG
jgi:hypothetical protein